MRMTFDFHDNELKMSAFLTERLAEISRALDPAEMTASSAQGPVQHEPLPDHAQHRRHGNGSDPATSVLNRATARAGTCTTSSCPAAPRCFRRELTATTRPDTVGALTYWTADAIRDRYLRKIPGRWVEERSMRVASLHHTRSHQSRRAGRGCGAGGTIRALIASRAAVILRCSATAQPATPRPGGPAFAGGLGLRNTVRHDQLAQYHAGPRRPASARWNRPGVSLPPCAMAAAAAKAHLYPAMPYPAYTKMTRRGRAGDPGLSGHARSRSSNAA